jgi:hypothetical protein
VGEPAIAVATLELRHLGRRVRAPALSVEFVGGLDPTAPIVATERYRKDHVVQECARWCAMHARTVE